MMPITRLATATLISASALFSLSATADDQRYNQISLSAEVSKEIAHDLMHVTLYSEDQSSDPAELATKISTSMNDAISQARKVKGITVTSGSRNSYPVYDDKGQKITAWRERAELRLESADFAVLSKLTGELLGNLKMGGMNFSIADTTRKTNEDALMKSAIEAFKARAKIATEALGGKHYKIVNLSLNSGGYNPPVFRTNMVMAKGAAMMADATPEIEAGSSQVNVSASGTIEVQPL
ncbi:SIMPL domain-containing protein [Ectopseudomonas mendocina]|uniref:SIMPL domain-containing protein n=1 Tax=Ectopseudomonas mendocina TaxID=300 RepID=A0ABZ2RI53_ECTME